MELDDLKYVFFEHASKAVSPTNHADIGKMLKRRSVSPLSSLKRNLKTELFITFIFIVFPIYMLAAYNGQYISALAIFFLLIAAFFILNIIRILKSIRRFEYSTNAIRQHLKLLVSILKSFCSLYIQSTVILIPVFFWAAALLIYYDNRQLDPLLFRTDFPLALSIYLAISVAWTVGMYFFSKWYVKKWYGNHLKQLQLFIEDTQ